MRIAVIVLLAVVCCSELVRACTTSADCSVTQCCLNSNRPIGKRQLHFGESTCQPRGTEGSGCLVANHYDPHRMYYKCPCREGLTCQGLGVFDVPLGEAGTCL